MMMRCWEGWLALLGVGAFIGIVGALHLLQSDYDWRGQLMSELALGAHGWAMLPAFCSLSLALLGIQHGLGMQRGVHFLQAVLMLAALSFAGAGVVTLRDAPDWHIASISLAFVFGHMRSTASMPSRERPRRS